MLVDNRTKISLPQFELECNFFGFIKMFLFDVVATLGVPTLFHW